jgi:type I restriction enzyme S subunit
VLITLQMQSHLVTTHTGKKKAREGQIRERRQGLIGARPQALARNFRLERAQLLTGKTRLPGFEGEWRLTRLSEIGSTYGGLTGKSKTDFGAGSARYVTFVNVMANVIIDSGAFEPVRVAPTESQNRVICGDLLFNGSSETPEEVALCSLVKENMSDLFLNSFCFGFRLRNEALADGLFLAYYIRGSEGRDLMKSLAQGSTRYNLSKRALLEAEVKIPAKAEQSAIAAVIADMDAELAALEARREKTRALKQGMMQELLTGRTRLV